VDLAQVPLHPPQRIDRTNPTAFTVDLDGNNSVVPP
jgi:hypothetical protein